MKKILEQVYAAKCKVQAVQPARVVVVPAAAKKLVLVEQMLHNWVQVSVAGKRRHLTAKP